MTKETNIDKLKLAHLPTPIHFLEKTSKKVSKHGERKIYLKRDDFTHGVAAGNKIRKLEYFFAEAKSKNKKVIFTCGGVQSNHARATAFLCRQLGLECVLLLRGEAPQEKTANLLLDLLASAKVMFLPEDEYRDIGKAYIKYAEPYRVRDGVMPLFIPSGGSNDIGGMGYYSAFSEIVEQLNERELPQKFDSIVVANGSGGTHAGLLLGKLKHGWDESKVISFNVCDTAKELTDKVKWIMAGTIQRFRLPLAFMYSDIHVIDGYVGPGYAKAEPSLYKFIQEVASDEGVLFDPVYTGKAFLGLVTELSSSKERADFFGENILFIHTGGLPSVFAHTENWNAILHEKK